jgi:organic radical activating enzyme
MKNKLLISSDFYSVQGEGISTGIPSYFVRLANCNLTCGMSRIFANKILKEKLLDDGEIFKGDLELEGKASWTCDSTSQWLWRGVEQDFQYLIDQWKEQNLWDDILNGDVHIIWTGGEPTIKGHQEAIVNFLNEFEQQSIKEFYGDSTSYSDGDFNIFNEIETNGTIIIDEPLFVRLSQINCSPKLANSGMTEKQRINPEAIKRIMSHSNYQFKFVISNEEDIKEIFSDFIVPFSIPLKNVVVMPGMDARWQFHERTNFIMEMAKKYKFRAMSRMHISAWDKTLDC